MANCPVVKDKIDIGQKLLVQEENSKPHDLGLLSLYIFQLTQNLEFTS